MDEVVWVCGNAAVGKETFIRHVASKKDQALVKSLGWANAQFSVIEESIQWVAYDPGHPFIKKREELPDLVARMATSKSGDKKVFLLKGQFVDTEARRMETLAAMLPQASHSILFLDASPEDIFLRLKKKPWFKDTFDLKRVKSLLVYEVGLLKNVDREIKKIVVESGNNYRYWLIETPENISQYFEQAKA